MLKIIHRCGKELTYLVAEGYRAPGAIASCLNGSYQTFLYSGLEQYVPYPLVKYERLLKVMIPIVTVLKVFLDYDSIVENLLWTVLLPAQNPSCFSSRISFTVGRVWIALRTTLRE